MYTLPLKGSLHTVPLGSNTGTVSQTTTFVIFNTVTVIMLSLSIVLGIFIT